MLADSVEASSRTLVDPTPARIRAHVTKIVKGVYAEGQLDESDLTFRDLNKLIDSFVRGITGLFHQRIAYPEEKPDPHKNGRKNEECRKDEAEELRPEWVIEPGRAKEKRGEGRADGARGGAGRLRQCRGMRQALRPRSDRQGCPGRQRNFRRHGVGQRSGGPCAVVRRPGPRQ